MPLIAFILVIVALAGGYVAFFRNDAPVSPEPVAPAVVETIPIEPSAQIQITEADSTTTSPDDVTTPVVVADPAPVQTTTPKPTTPPAVTPTTPSTPTTPPAVTPPASKTVTSQTVTYRTPARSDNQVAVTVTLTNNTVSDVSVNYNGGNGVYNNYQKRFDGDYRTQVVGKSISDISLSRVGGASLTSKAFNDALASVPR